LIGLGEAHHVGDLGHGVTARVPREPHGRVEQVYTFVDQRDTHAAPVGVGVRPPQIGEAGLGGREVRAVGRQRRRDPRHREDEWGHGRDLAFAGWNKCRVATDRVFVIDIGRRVRLVDAPHIEHVQHPRAGDHCDDITDARINETHGCAEVAQ
jgi:hypothetical protein